MPLKYQTQLENTNRQPCPCLQTHTAKHMTAFRFVNNQATENDFLPVAELGQYDGSKCEHWALSFFDSAASAKAKFATLLERLNDEAFIIFGTHIGEINILPADGISSTPSSYGHIRLHEEAGVTFVNRVVNYHQLP